MIKTKGDIPIKTVLILSPHTDDGELGCGGSIARFIEEGKEVYYCAFSTAETSVPKGYPKNILETEVKKATSALNIPKNNLFIFKYNVRKLNYVRQDILEHLVVLNKKIKPDLVFMPVKNDLHQDHSTVAMEGLRAFKQCSILGYELPWNSLTFNTQSFITLKQKHITKKIKALSKYKSQSHREYMKESFIKSWAHTRGIQIGTQYAETFEVMRWTMA